MCVVGNRPKQTTVPRLISGSIKYLVGGIHKLRRQDFADFWPPPLVHRH